MVRWSCGVDIQDGTLDGSEVLGLLATMRREVQQVLLPDGLASCVFDLKVPPNYHRSKRTACAYQVRRSHVIFQMFRV